MKKFWKKLVAFEPTIYKFTSLLLEYIRLFFAIVGLIALCKQGDPRTFDGITPDEIIKVRLFIVMMTMGLALGTGFLRMCEKGFFDLQWLLVRTILVPLLAIGGLYSFSFLVYPTTFKAYCFVLVIFWVSIDLFYFYPRWLYLNYWKPIIRRIENEK